MVFCIVATMPAQANDTIVALQQRHAELTARLDALDTSVRARVRRDLLDQLDAWRTGLDDFDNAQFREQLARALQTAQSYGMDVDRLRALYDASVRVILRADLVPQALTSPADPLARLAQYLDWAGEEQARLAEAEAAAQQQRVELHRLVSLAFVEALLERDAGVAEARFRAYTDAIRTIASAEVDALVADAEAIAADLEVVQTIAAGVPYVGDALDIVALAEGRQPLTGEVLGGLDWTLTLLGVAVGPVDQLVKRVPLAQRVIDNAVALARELADPLVATGRYSREQLAALVSRFGGGDAATLAAARAQSRIELAALNQQAIARWNDTAEGRAAAAAWETANAVGAARVADAGPLFESLVSRAGGSKEELRHLVARGVTQVSPDADWVELTQAYIAIRQDKRAIGVLKDADAQLREQFFDFEQALFGTVEVRGGVAVNLGDGIVDYMATSAMSRRLTLGFEQSRFAGEADLAGAKQVESWLRSYAARMGDNDFRLEKYIDPHNPQIQVFNASNAPPRRGDIGADRDITYQLVLHDGHRIDVPASFVAPHYDDALYSALNGLSDSTPEQRRRFTELMDHAVTDGTVLEAYRPGMDVGEFLGTPGVAVSATGAEDLASTIAYKGQEWFERGNAAMRSGLIETGWTDISEGMRQLTKQYDNLVVTRLERMGLNEAAHVPPLLGEAIELMKRVTYADHLLPTGATRLNPAEAEAAIKAMGFASLDDVANQLGLYFEALEKSRQGGGR